MAYVWYCTKPTRQEAMLLEKKLKNLSRSRLEGFVKKYTSSPNVSNLIEDWTIIAPESGEMPEWPNGAVSKTAILARVSRVETFRKAEVSMLTFRQHSNVHLAKYQEIHSNKIWIRSYWVWNCSKRFFYVLRLYSCLTYPHEILCRPNSKFVKQV